MGKQSLSIFNFSKFIIKIALLILIFGLCLNYIFEEKIIFKSEISGAYKINRIINETKANEIPIFGSSLALRSFVPSILGKNYFNYGIAGTQANIWLFFLEQELQKEKSTPIIINYGLRGFVKTDGDMGSYIPNWKKTKSILNNQGKFYYNIPFIKYFGKFELYTKYFFNNKINLTKVTDRGGSFDKIKLTQKKFQQLVSKRLNSKASFRLDKELLLKFNELVESTSRHIIFVVTPFHKSYFNKFTSLDLVNDHLASLDAKKNIKVIDLRHFITKDEMFKNTTHLNYNGAVEFSKKLNERLTALIISNTE